MCYIFETSSLRHLVVLDLISEESATSRAASILEPGETLESLTIITPESNQIAEIK